MTEQINSLSAAWWGWMWPMFWQAGALILVIGAIDFVIRRHVWPQLRYALWLLVLVKLVLPPSLSLSTSVTSRMGPLARRAVVREAKVGRPLWKPEKGTGSAGPVESTSAPAVAAGPKVEAIDVARPTYDASAESVGASGGGREAAGAIDGQAGVAARLSWRSWSMLGWLAGVLVLAAWLVLRFRQLRLWHSKKADASALPPWFAGVLAGAGRNLGIRRLPNVVFSESVVCPAVFGVFRPVLLLPKEEMAEFSQEDVRHVLLHELAHIKRGDLWVHAVQMVLQVVYWFNPLLWFVRRRLQDLRELCCDATVAGILRGQTCGYRQTIVETARRLLAGGVGPGLGLLGLFEDSSRLPARLRWLEKKSWKRRRVRVAVIFGLVVFMLACVLPMARLPGRRFRFAGGPLDIRLAAVRPDGCDDLYDAEGNKIAENTFAEIDAQWSKESQYCTFIFTIPEANAPVLFTRFLQVKPAGERHGFGTSQRPFLWNRVGHLTYGVGVSFPRTYKKFFTRRVKAVDLALRYYWGPRGKADFTFRGPFVEGQTVEADGAAGCSLTTKKDRLNFGNHVAAFFTISSETPFDKDSVLVYDTSGVRHLVESGGGHSGRGGARYDFCVEGLTLRMIGYVTVGEKAHERRFDNVRVHYGGRAERERMEFLDEFSERLGLGGATGEELHDYEFSDPADAIKVVDIVRGRWYVMKVFNAIAYGRPRISIPALDEESQQKVRTAAAAWADAGSPEIRAWGIELGLRAGRPEFFDMALQAISGEPRLYETGSPWQGRMEQEAIGDIANAINHYGGQVGPEKLGRIRQIVLRAGNQRILESLLTFLYRHRTPASLEIWRQLEEDDRPWIWWPAMKALYNQHIDVFQPFESLSRKTRLRLILVTQADDNYPPRYKLPEKDAGYEALANEAYSMLPGMFTPELARMNPRRAWFDIYQVTAKKLDRRLATETFVEFIRAISTEAMQEVWAADDLFFSNCCWMTTYVIRRLNVWYDVDIGQVGKDERHEAIPRNIIELKRMAGEALRWHEGSPEAAGSARRLM
ncbi:MAG: M56 family metallopeptidase [Phycisphaerales bacterium]|nr:MAG: M56 family metallopeptidase [Phycisphaerales bacterium]